MQNVLVSVSQTKVYMLKYLKSGKEHNSPNHITSAYNNLALISWELHQIDSAMHYSHLALRNAKRNKDIDGEHTIYNSLIRIYLSENEYDSAYYYLQKALISN